MILFTALQANHEVQHRVRPSRRVTWFAHRYCVRCFHVRWGVAKRDLFSNIQILLWSRRLFLILINWLRLFIARNVHDLLCTALTPTGARTWVACVSARWGNTEIWIRVRRRHGGGVRMLRLLKACGFARLRYTNVVLPVQRKSSSVMF